MAGKFSKLNDKQLDSLISFGDTQVYRILKQLFEETKELKDKALRSLVTSVGSDVEMVGKKVIVDQAWIEAYQNILDLPEIALKEKNGRKSKRESTDKIEAGAGVQFAE